MDNVKILVVEDEPVVAKTVKYALEALGYVVLATAASAGAAIELAATLHPDLVLMDIKLPGEIDGVAAADAIRARFDIPVVYLTAYSDKKTLERAKISEPFGYVLKPFKEKDLHSTIELALYKHTVEQKLRQSEARFRALIENITDIIFVLDRQGSVNYASPSIQRVLGYEPEAVLGRTFLEFLHPDEAAEVRQSWGQVTDGPVVLWSGEARIRHKDGSWRTLEASGHNRLDDPSVQGIVISAHDITDRRLADQALRESEQRYRTLYNQTPAMLHSIDREYRLVYVSDYWLEALGYERSEVIGRKSTEFLTEASRRHAEEVALPLYFKTGVAKDVPYQFVKKNGAIIDVLLSAVAERDAAGEIVRSLAVLVDVTEQKRAAEALAASEARYRALVESSEDTIFQIDPEGRYSFINAAGTRALGRTQEEVVGRKLSEVFSGETDAITTQMLQTVIQTRAPLREEHPLIVDEKTLQYSTALVPLIDGNGQLESVVGIGRDITELKRTEEILWQRTIELQAQNEELNAYAHTVAHDLKNPLGRILGAAELLTEEGDAMSKQEIQQLTQHIAQGANTMANIIDNLLLLASARNMDIEVQPLDMARIVMDAQRQLVREIKGHTAEIVAPETWPTVVGHAPWVEEVWVNYISNAIKYGGKPPRVELGATVMSDNQVRFWVRDNGQGLTPQQQTQLFTPFERLDQVRVKGHGLGLSIVRRIVEKLGGQVGVESQVGQGSTFFFTLPPTEVNDACKTAR